MNASQSIKVTNSTSDLIANDMKEKINSLVNNLNINIADIDKYYKLIEKSNCVGESPLSSLACDEYDKEISQLHIIYKNTIKDTLETEQKIGNIQERQNYLHNNIKELDNSYDEFNKNIIKTFDDKINSIKNEPINENISTLLHNLSDPNEENIPKDGSKNIKSGAGYIITFYEKIRDNIKENMNKHITYIKKIDEDYNLVCNIFIIKVLNIINNSFKSDSVLIHGTEKINLIRLNSLIDRRKRLYENANIQNEVYAYETNIYNKIKESMENITNQLEEITIGCGGTVSEKNINSQQISNNTVKIAEKKIECSSLSGWDKTLISNNNRILMERISKIVIPNYNDNNLEKNETISKKYGDIVNDLIKSMKEAETVSFATTDIKSKLRKIKELIDKINSKNNNINELTNTQINHDMPQRRHQAMSPRRQQAMSQRRQQAMSPRRQQAMLPRRQYAMPPQRNYAMPVDRTVSFNKSLPTVINVGGRRRRKTGKKRNGKMTRRRNTIKKPKRRTIRR